MYIACRTGKVIHLLGKVDIPVPLDWIEITGDTDTDIHDVVVPAMLVYFGENYAVYEIPDEAETPDVLDDEPIQILGLA